MRIHALGLMAFGSITSIMMTIPVLSLYLSERGLPPAHVGAVIGAMSLAIVFAEVPVVGGLLAAFGLRWAFAVVLPVIVIALLLLRDRGGMPHQTLREQHPVHDHGGE